MADERPHQPAGRRKWKRTATIVLLLLAAGAVVNVAVGWYAAIWLPAMSVTDSSRSLNEDVDEIDSRALQFALSACEVRWLRRNGLESLANEIGSRDGGEGFGCRMIAYYQSINKVYGMLRVIRVDCGWPLYAFSGVNKPGHYEIRQRTDAESWLFFHLPAIAKQILPYRIVPVNFVLNTLFYALLLWLLIATSFAARRMIRRKRGLCEKCAYPIGDSEVCTECGAAVRTSLARSS